MGNLVGDRFKPKDEEIISLLNKKRIDPDFSVQTSNEVDNINFEISDLPRLSALQWDELVWYFLCAPFYKYTNSKRANRKTTGRHSNEVIGCEDDNASKKHKAEWVMHEFRSHYDSPHTVQTLHLPNHLHMSYDFRNHVAENGFSTVEPQQLPSRHLQIDSRNQVAEKIIQGVDLEELADMTSSYRNNVAENIFTTEESQLLPNQLLAYDSRNHVAEKMFSGVEYQLSSQYLTSYCRNHVAEKTLSMVDCQQLPSHYFNSTSDCRNHVAENNFVMDESQLLLSHHLVSLSRNHVAENNYPQVESQQLPSQYSMSDFRVQVAEHRFSGGEPMLFALHFDGLNYNKQEDMSSQLAVQDKYPLEEKLDTTFLLAAIHQNQSPKFSLGTAVPRTRELSTHELMDILQ